jgi:hypothetical protein
MPLDATQQRSALQRIAAWRSDPKQPVACPACGREGLAIIDRSARPYARMRPQRDPARRVGTTGADTRLRSGDVRARG